MAKSQENSEYVFWSRIITNTSGCWIYLYGNDKDGYGRFQIKGKVYRAHRYSFLLFYNYLPKMACHTCDTPQCVNPKHLFAGDALLNNRDKIKKGRTNYHRGEKSYQATFTNDEVIDLRAKHKNGLKFKSISHEYPKLKKCTYDKIVGNKTWKHLL